MCVCVCVCVCVFIGIIMHVCLYVMNTNKSLW